MPRSLAKNIELRFGSPPAIRIVPVSLRPGEMRIQNERIFEAYHAVLDSVLKRPATEGELFGVRSLEAETDQKKVRVHVRRA